MIWKLLAAFVVFGLIWAVFFRPKRQARVADKRKTLKTAEFAKCPDCGIYLPKGAPCGCIDRS